MQSVDCAQHKGSIHFAYFDVTSPIARALHAFLYQFVFTFGIGEKKSLHLGENRETVVQRESHVGEMSAKANTHTHTH